MTAIATTWKAVLASDQRGPLVTFTAGTQREAFAHAQALFEQRSKTFAAPQNVPLVRPHPNPDASVLERLKALPTLRVTHAPQPASKSP